MKTAACKTTTKNKVFNECENNPGSQLMPRQEMVKSNITV